MLKGILFVVIFGLLFIGTFSAFAQAQDTLSVTTSKKSYTEGDTIVVSGKAKNYDKESPQVTLQVFDPTGNLVRIDLVRLKSDGVFQTSFSATGTFRIEGEYSIQASYDGNKATNTFEFIEIVDNTPPQAPIVPNFLEFFDPKIGAQYYLDRYYNESEYKSWFDSNFPDYTIEKAIELAIPGSISESPQKQTPPSFIDPQNGAQYYLDRYYNESEYKSWFDYNFPDYTIEQAIELAIPSSISDIPIDSDQNDESNSKLPQWVKNIFIWYAEEKISEDELLGAIQFLLDQGILKK
ncbi:MAG TPA: hypothetical protein VD731_06885 [Nitrosopumilaceae archaeon]|nr:hypothetical protein [Nitrosopumilaceae archaeon]